MPRMIKFYVTHVIIGFAVAACFVAAILWFNIGNIAHLISHTEGGYLALSVFWVLNGIVFASVQFGIAVMALQVKDNGNTPRGGLGQMVPVRVRSGISDKR